MPENLALIGAILRLPLTDEPTKIMMYSALAHDDPFLHHMVLYYSAQVDDIPVTEESFREWGIHFENKFLREYYEKFKTAEKVTAFNERRELMALLTVRKKDVRNKTILDLGLAHPSSLVRRAAVQWVGEERLVDFRPQVTAILDDPAITADLFLATLAALEMLDGIPPQEFDMTPPGKYVIPIVRNKIRPAAVRALALRLVPPDDPALDGELLANLLTTDDLALKRETIRTLNASPVPQAAELLRGIVKNDQQPLADRIEATAGLASSAAGLDQKSLETLADLTYGSPAQFGTDLYIEALRSLRGVAGKDATLDLMLSRLGPLSPPTTPAELDLAEQLSFALVGSRYGLEAPIAQAIAERRPKTAEEWLSELEGEGNAERGRRVFYHSNSAGCFKCHTFDGRGGKIGPDLTNFGRNATPEKVLTSILTPSKEIAPQFTTWTLVDKDGRTYSGMIVHENEGKTLIGDAEGKLTELPTIDIIERVAQKVSIMPEKLIDKLTVQELRDLVAFLRNAPND
ncbi:MAG: c-type cytochrome [Planctomycetaceae bacterium]